MSKQSQPDVRDALSLAAASAKRGDFEAAIVHLKEVLRAAPDHEIANGMLAGLYAELKMPERATACYERVLATNPHNVLALFQLGLLLRELNKPAEAHALLQRAAQQMPADHPLQPRLQELLRS